MLLFFRFCLAILKGRLRRRIGVLDESSLRFTVLPTDCDLNFHLNAGRFISLMDVARMELITHSRLLPALVKKKWRPIMGGIVVRYRRSILPLERFTIRSRVLGWDEKWFYIEHIVEKDGVFCASGIVRMLVRGATGNIAPPDVLALTGAAMPSPPLPDFVLGWRALEDAR
ncbi:MAG TPA: thioesterase family protein [Thermoanaerobaculia bacterium]|nr:thioesterase family protein [Thermoanaerobaculia bacterium]